MNIKIIGVFVLAAMVLAPQAQADFWSDLRDDIKKSAKESDSKKSSGEKKLSNQESKKKNTNQSGKFALQGCGAGAVGAVILGKLLDKDAKKRRQYAAWACAIGGLAGYQIGRRTQKYANEQTALVQETKINKKLLADMRSRNQQLAININDTRKNINEIKRAKIGEQDKKKMLINTKKALHKRIANNRKILAGLNSEIKIARNNKNRYGRNASHGQKRHWENQIVSLERERNRLSQHVNSLVAMGNSI